MGEDFIRIEEVSKSFGATLAVDRVTLLIRRGEFFSLLGPSGCGKTTLLRMIGGFVIPDSGAIFIDGEEVTNLPPNRRPTNMVFQSYAIFPHLNVADNIAYGLRRERPAAAERARRIDEALKLVRLEGFGARAAGELSGGQRQRVALARALIKRPKVLLLDEPLGALDRRLREAMQIELRQLQRELGITFVFVTHDQEEALSMSDRIAVMSEGRILQVAEPKSLYDSPESREVANFIGTMNVLEGVVEAVNGKEVRVATAAFGAFAAVAAHPEKFRAGERVLIAIRPEKLSLAREGSPGAVKGWVSAIAYLGDRQQIQIGVENYPAPLTATVQHLHMDGPAPMALGETVYVSWPPDAPILLPAG